jgi:predicted nucleotidyltransferase component of viral defense system
MSERDYTKLYRIQNKVLESLKSVLGNFYLTGGTALGRFYLNHRYSEDLDFFVNSDPAFQERLERIEKRLSTSFSIDREQTVKYEDYARYFIENENSVLKIEFVNDVQYRCGEPLGFRFGLIDTPLNILTNKLTAIISREEPKDIYDIFSISTNYSFNWINVFKEAKKKVIINEIEVEQRIKEFPVTMMFHADWIMSPLDHENFMRIISIIANDFILGKNNSAGENKPPIENATPLY